MFAYFRHCPFKSRTPPRYHWRFRRKIDLVLARARRAHYRLNRSLTLFTGWVWVAAVSFVGFEMFDVIFGTFILAPEFLPIVLIGLACAWYFRGRLRRTWVSVRARLRLAGVHHRTRAKRSTR